MATVNGHSAAKYNSLMEGGDIDRDQIVDGHLLPDEYFCPICRCLLWNPRSCASCQHLFCQKCIQTWLEYSKNDKTCPFRCQSYDERRCPPSFHSLLSRVKIHCRNAPFGCSEVLAYDSLERHENVECKYLTRTCPECMKLILVSEFIEHIQVAGNCIPCPIRCTICKSFIEKTEFRNHFNECYMNRFNDMFQQFATLRSRTTGQQELLPLTTEQRNMQLLQTMLNTLNSFEEQRQNSRLPTNLLGIDTIRQARERGCGHLYHIFLMIVFILKNWRKAPYLIWIISFSGFLTIGLVIIGVYVICLSWIAKHIYRGFSLIMLFSSLSSFGIPYFFRFVPDKWIIFSVGLILFCFGCSLRGPLEAFEIGTIIDKTIFNVILCCLGVLIMKIFLLFLRFFFWFSPIYLTAAVLTFIHTFIVLRLRRSFNANTTTNPV